MTTGRGADELRHVELPEASVPAQFAAHCRADPDRPALHYFGRTLTRGEVDELSRNVASRLRSVGVASGDRVGLSLQNTPVFVLTALATWRLGAILVPVNPMLRAKELGQMAADSELSVLVADPGMRGVVDEVVAATGYPSVCLWSSADELAGPDFPFADDDASSFDPADGVLTFAADGADDEIVTDVATYPDDPALLTYTSGTTGPAKGAINTHRGLMYQAAMSREWFGLDDTSSILTMAPLFHITGLGLHLSVGLANGIPLVLTFRFEPRAVARLVETYRPTFTIGAITAFAALLNEPECTRDRLASLTEVYSGGAPVAAGLVSRYEDTFGPYIRNMYGLTETTSACIGVPRGKRAPVDPGSGALSIGVALPDTDVVIVDDDGRPVPAGEVGEIVVSGPQVVPGYWNRPTETAHAFRHDGVHTGDVGLMDADGYCYVVDRKKDLIIVSGYKVWPRDVEDVLYDHPAVLEAAVVGVPDEYRGESVTAFVRVSETVDTAELDAHCRAHLAAYKVPRAYEFTDELPKTATGKILRRELRSDAGPGAGA